MFIILLKFSSNKAAAPAHMQAHNAWLQQGFADGVFLTAGSIKPGQGGAILAHRASAAEIATRVAADPFVKEAVVQAEVLEIAVARSNPDMAAALGEVA